MKVTREQLKQLIKEALDEGKGKKTRQYYEYLLKGLKFIEAAKRLEDVESGLTHFSNETDFVLRSIIDVISSVRPKGALAEEGKVTPPPSPMAPLAKRPQTPEQGGAEKIGAFHMQQKDVAQGRTPMVEMGADIEAHGKSVPAEAIKNLADELESKHFQAKTDEEIVQAMGLEPVIRRLRDIVRASR